MKPNTTHSTAAKVAANCRPLSRRRRRGATTVEFCICAPVFLYAIFGAIEITRVVLIRNLAHDAAYDAARFCMVEGASAEEATQRARGILGLVGTRGATVTINNGGQLNETSGTVKVDISVPLNQNSLVLPWLFAGRTIDTSTELRTERYHGFYDSSTQ